MNPAHLDHDALAELAEGLLDDADAASANAHLDECAECRRRSEEITDVSRLLADIPVPPMPADLAARIDDAIRAEAMAASREAPAGMAAVASIPHHALERRRGRRRLAVLSAAAAAVVVVGGGAVLGTGVLGNSVLDGDHSASSQPPADNPRNVDGQPRANAEGGPLTVVRSGTDYQTGTLGDQVTGVVTRAGGLPKAETSSRMVTCVQNATRGRVAPVLVDEARYDGRDATVIVVPTDGTTWRVLVTGQKCASGNLDLIEEITIPAGTP